MGIAQFGAAILKFCPEQEWTYPKIQVALATQLYFSPRDFLVCLVRQIEKRV